MNNAYFFQYMKNLLGERYAAFEEAYNNKPRHKALRVNTHKIDVDGFIKFVGKPFDVNKLCGNSLYSDVKPSLDPLYHAGLYYMQEPSASAAVAAFAPFIGERVLDLCAAPGGKSTQAAEYMNGGIIFCNDPEYKRVRALAENVERLGVNNAVVTCNSAADYRAAGFDGYFDTLIVDAPCSGGGMMRYEDVPYSAEIVALNAARQREILRDAVKLLSCGGYMLYSTCTFAKEENENNIAFLRTLGMETVDIPLRDGAERGIGERDARRVYPMNFDGEGHFFCVLKKLTDEDCEKDCERVKRGKAVFGGLTVATCTVGNKTFADFGHDIPRLSGLNVVRLGVAVKGDDGEISHALTHALTTAEVEKVGFVALTNEQAEEYIRGKQLDIAAPKGILIATVNGFALGAVKSAAGGDGGHALKNRYPKYLRIT